MSMTWRRPGRRCCRCCGITRVRCLPWPTAGTKAQVTGSSRRKKPKGVTELDIDARTRNMLLSSARCLGERGFALLSQRWKTLQNVIASPGKIGQIARAALVLVLFEHKRLT